MSAGVLAALLVGVVVAIQAAVLGAYGDRLHPVTLSMWAHAGGLLFGIIVVTVGRFGFGWSAFRAAPWGAIAGVGGFLIITGLTIAVASIGVASTLAIVIASQLALTFVFEAVGFGGRQLNVDPWRLFGAALMVIGAWLVASRGAGG
ncbi:MAG: DMT family transporter [Nitriliruptoraceae bacterium]